MASRIPEILEILEIPKLEFCDVLEELKENNNKFSHSSGLVITFRGNILTVTSRYGANLSCSIDNMDNKLFNKWILRHFQIVNCLNALKKDSRAFTRIYTSIYTNDYNFTTHVNSTKYGQFIVDRTMTPLYLIRSDEGECQRFQSFDEFLAYIRR